METGKERTDETREMRLFTKVIRLSKTPEKSLPEYIAVRRQPGSDRWRTWDEITIDLHQLTGEVVTDVSLRRWASRYGIPEGTQREGGVITEAEYAEAMQKSGITL